MDKNSSNCSDKIRFSKYLNCQACKESGLYCDEHKKEVEKILSQLND